MSNLAQIQSAFTAALFDPAAAPPFPLRGPRDARRFRIYRNNVAMGLILALSTRYPVVKRLVGDEFFAEMARSYARAEPPRSPILLSYGESFPDFISGFQPAQPIRYLGAVARIEWARGAAYHAADVSPMGAAAFAAIMPEQLGALRLTMHPSMSVVRSAFPIYSIWKVNQSRSPVIPVAPWAPEAAVIARCGQSVSVKKLLPGQAVFLDALLAGEPFADAVIAASEDAADFDTAQGLTLLIRSELVARFGRSRTATYRTAKTELPGR
jgi:hypothetical protein